MDSRTLPERQQAVLSSVIRHYVTTARPVGSHVIAREMDVSSATIRNALLELEQKGFLTHPHTSAGRVPIDPGYRFYVDRLMKARLLTLKERQAVEREYERTRDEVDSLLRHTAKILAAMTQLAGLAVVQVFEEASLDHFKLVVLDPKKVMVILVIGDGLVREEVVALEEPLQEREAVRIAQVLNSRFAGSPLSAIRRELLKEAESVKRNKLAILERTVRLIDGALSLTGEQIRLEGAARLTEQPEFRGSAEMERVLRLVEEKRPLAQALGRGWSNPGLSVEIGREFPEAFMCGFSFVHAPYRYKGRVLGALGVLGPTRMPYDRVAGVVGHLAGVLEEALAKRGG